jgi:hypothetical protein
MFPITHEFYPIWLAQSLTPLYKTKKVKSKDAYLSLFCNWGLQKGVSFGACSMFQKHCYGPINMAPLKKI